MDNCHDASRSLASAEIVWPTLLTKNKFDGTKLSVDRRGAKTTTYGINCHFRLSTTCAIVRQTEIDRGTLRDHTCRIDHRMARVLVLLDLREVHSLRNTRNLVQLEQVVPQIRIVEDAP